MTGEKRKAEIDYEADRILRWIARMPYSQVVVAVVGALSIIGMICLVQTF